MHFSVLKVVALCISLTAVIVIGFIMYATVKKIKK